MLHGKWRSLLTASMHHLLKITNHQCMKDTSVVIIKSIHQLLLAEIFLFSQKKNMKLKSLIKLLKFESVFSQKQELIHIK